MRYVELSGYSLFRNDRLIRWGEGVCIYVSDQISGTLIELNVDVGETDVLFVKIYNKSITFILGCVYYLPTTSFADDRSTL